jgi:hypothetical protein
MGLIRIEEQISLTSISEHINSLAKESNRKGSAQGMLEARLLAGEATEVLRLVQLAVDTEAWVEGGRKKRNVLVNMISSLTGLATQGSITQQQTYDRELRRKIEDLVRTQQVEATTIEQMVTTLEQDEETLAGRLNQLQYMHQQDMTQLQRHNIRKHFGVQDLQAMKGILASVHSGIATPEQTIRFTARMKAGS